MRRYAKNYSLTKKRRRVLLRSPSQIRSRTFPMMFWSARTRAWDSLDASVTTYRDCSMTFVMWREHHLRVSRRANSQMTVQLARLDACSCKWKGCGFDAHWLAPTAWVFTDRGLFLKSDHNFVSNFYSSLIFFYFTKCFCRLVFVYFVRKRFSAGTF